jgi:hypothetical protein
VILYWTTLDQFRTLDRTKLGELSKLYLDETIIYLELVETLPTGPTDGWLDEVAALLNNAANVSAFPIGRLANALGTLGPILARNAKYADCFERAMEAKGAQEGGFSKAATLRDRAISYANAQQLEDAIVMATRSKLLWFNEKTRALHN